jgi:adenosylhomocysteinase
MRSKGLGALVTVTEVDPVKAIEARMDGFDVMPMSEAVKTADIVLTVTGCKDIVTKKDFMNMKDGCVLGNAGHFDNEISKKDLNELAVSKEQVRDFIDCYTMKDGRKFYLIGEGRLMNLAAGQGHPAEIMDTSFSTQAMAIVYMVENHDKLKNNVIPVPDEIDDELARIKLRTLGISIDKLTEEQYNYIHSWQEGT